MNRPDQDRLLRELLADENVEHLREASLARGLSLLHARRKRRALVSAVAASTAVAALLALLAPKHGPQPAGPPMAPVSSTSTVKIIDDQQLLALFPDRTVALIGAPGNRKLVFFDPPSSPAAPSRYP